MNAASGRLREVPPAAPRLTATMPACCSFCNLIGKGPGDLFIFRKDRDPFSAVGDAAKQPDGVVCFSCDEQ